MTDPPPAPSGVLSSISSSQISGHTQSTGDSATKAAVEAVDSGVSGLQAAADETVQKGFGSPTVASPVSNASKQLDFDLGLKSEPKTPSTPAVTPKPTTAAPATYHGDVDYNQFVIDVLLWTSLVRSIFYLIAGTAVIILVDILVENNVPLITVICHLTLAQMALNFARHVMSPSLQQKATWLDSAWTHAAIDNMGTSVKTLAAVHDKHLNATSPHKHLIIAVSLWILSLCCVWISPTHLALALYIGSFIVPKVYLTYRGAIDPKAQDTFSKIKAKLDAADHRLKAGVIALLVLALGCISTLNFIIAVFIVSLLVTSQMPKEIEELSKKAAPVLTPLGKTAASVGDQIGRMVGGAVQKYELTPTPSKKKKQ